jgi:tRNA(fMet)-specific endonuclease VapC
MKVLLDTNICIHALKQHPGVLARLLAEARPDVTLSVITEAELRTGAAKSASPTKTHRLLEHFLAPMTVLAFTSEDAVAYAHVRAKLERAGTPIGPLDTLIASQAIARDLTLITSNEREFRRVLGLRVENWAS